LSEGKEPLSLLPVEEVEEVGPLCFGLSQPRNFVSLVSSIVSVWVLERLGCGDNAQVLPREDTLLNWIPHW
jgi:hypothetical protein